MNIFTTLGLYGLGQSDDNGDDEKEKLQHEVRQLQYQLRIAQQQQAWRAQQAQWQQWRAEYQEVLQTARDKTTPRYSGNWHDLVPSVDLGELWVPWIVPVDSVWVFVGFKQEREPAEDTTDLIDMYAMLMEKSLPHPWHWLFMHRFADNPTQVTWWRHSYAPTPWEAKKQCEEVAQQYREWAQQQQAKQSRGRRRS